MAIGDYQGWGYGGEGEDLAGIKVAGGSRVLSSDRTPTVALLHSTNPTIGGMLKASRTVRSLSYAPSILVFDHFNVMIQGTEASGAVANRHCPCFSHHSIHILDQGAKVTMDSGRT